MKKKWKIIFGAVVIIVAVGFIATQAMEETEIEVIELARKDIKRSFTEEGVVEASKERTVYPLPSAKIDELLIAEGDMVNKGDLIAVLDQSELRFNLRELQARLNALDGEAKQLTESPGEAELEDINKSIEQAKDNLDSVKESYERTKELYEKEIETLEINIEQAEENLQSAENNYNRMKTLYENDLISEHELEEVEDIMREAKHHLTRQETALENKKLALEHELEEMENMKIEAEYNLARQKNAKEMLEETYSPLPGSKEIIDANRQAINSQVDFIHYQLNNYYHIYAPISGIIAELNVEEDEIVSPQTLLMNIFQKEDYVVKTRVLTRDIYDISEGMTVELILELRDEDIKFDGQVKSISPYAKEDVSPLGLEEERVEVSILPDTPKDLEIFPGYKLDVEFTTDKKFGELVVPKSTLFTYDGEDALFVVEDDMINVRQVDTGFETRLDVVITSGLEDGDLVVLDPQASGVSEGSRVSYSIVNDLAD